MVKIIDGQAIAAKINAQTARRVKGLARRGIKPKLAVVLVGDDKASAVYVQQKAKIARQVGVDFVLHKFPAGIAQKDLIEEIKKIQEDKKLSGLIIQLPLPEQLYRPAVLNAIAPVVDVDFLSQAAMAEIDKTTDRDSGPSSGLGQAFRRNDNCLWRRHHKMEPPAPGAIMTILRELKFRFAKKNIAVVGQGALVGRPLTTLLRRAGATVAACDKKTKNIPAKCRRADVVISCAGKKNLIRGDMIKKGAIVIDAGFSFYQGKSYGDVNFAEAAARAGYITPTPGGVGPITVSLLLHNTVVCANKNFGS